MVHRNRKGICSIHIERVQKIRLATLIVKNFYSKYITSTTEHWILFSFPGDKAFHYLFEGRRRIVLVLHNLGLKWQHIYQQIRKGSLVLPIYEHKGKLEWVGKEQPLLFTPLRLCLACRIRRHGRMKYSCHVYSNFG